MPSNTITVNWNGKPLGEISEKCSPADMARACPLFFRTKFGKRETYTGHRGQLIVRFSSGFGQAGTDARRTAAYVFLVNGYAGSDDNTKTTTPDLFCVAHGSEVTSVRQAQRLIDKLLDGVDLSAV